MLRGGSDVGYAPVADKVLASIPELLKPSPTDRE